MKSHRLIIYLLLSTLLLSSCAMAPYHPADNVLRAPSNANEAIMLPSVEEDVEKLKVLMAISEEIPEIFSDAARYDINLFDILDDQEKLQKLLNENSDFQRLWNSKKYSEFTFKVKSKDNEKVETKQISVAAISNWKEQIKNFLKKNQRINLEKEISDRLDKSGKLTSSGIINGLILNLPKESQAKARDFQKLKDDEGLLSFLKNNLPEALPNFKAEGISSNPKRDDLLKMYREFTLSENSLGPLIDIYSFTQFRNQSIAEFYKNIDSLTRHDLENLSDPDYQNKIFSKLLDDDKPKVPAAYLKYLKFYTAQTEVLNSSVKIEYQVSIKEQNPNIAIFRGCTGGDCSSQYSFPYPNDPNERVFFIYDEKNQLKGYVTGTMTEINNNEKAFYVNTISGSRVNSVDTEVILQGLYKEKDHLGVKHIVLPTQKNIASLLNFGAIKSVYEKAIANRPTVPLQYQDTEIRTSIEEFKSENNTAAYDYMKTNADVVVYTPSQTEALDLQIEHKSSSLELKKLRIKEKFDPTTLIEFIISMEKSNRQRLISKILESAFVTDAKQAAAEKFVGLTTNSILKTEKLNSEIDSLAKTLEITPARLEEKKIQWFLNAFLSAPDAQSPENLTATLDKLVWDLKNNNPPLAIDRLVEKFQRNLYQHKDYQKTLDALEKKVLTNDTFLNDLPFEDIRFSLLADYINLLADSNDKSQNAKAKILYNRLQPNKYFGFAYNKFTSKKVLRELIKNAKENIAKFEDNKKYYFEIGVIATRALEETWREDMSDVMHEAIQILKNCPDEAIFADSMYGISHALGNQTIDIHDNIMELVKISQQRNNVYILRNAITLFSKQKLSQNSQKDFLEILSAAAFLKDDVSYQHIMRSYYFNDIVSKDKALMIKMASLAVPLNSANIYYILVEAYLGSNPTQNDYTTFMRATMESFLDSKADLAMNFFIKKVLTKEMSAELKTITLFEMLKAVRKKDRTTMLAEFSYIIDELSNNPNFPKELVPQMEKLTKVQDWESFDKILAQYENRKAPVVVNKGGSCQQIMESFL